MVDAYIEEIKSRCKEQNIDIDGCHILLCMNKFYFDGEEVRGCSESKDGRWVCIPIYDDELSMLSGKYEYSPQCFEVKQKMETYLPTGSMFSLATIWLLHEV